MSQAQQQDVSVVVPCYNGMPYLPQALDSALAQSLPALEIIVVDDGSKDDSAACAREYEGKSGGRVRLIQQANAGEPAARNTGIGAAGGEWVAMLDADDWWEPRKLEMQVRAAREAGPDCVLVHTGFVRHYPDGKVVPWDMSGSSRRVGWCTERLLEPASIGHPSIMVRKSALERIGGYDRTFRQACDIDLYFRLSAVGTFAFVSEHLLHYRMHEKQMSASQIEQIPWHHRAVRKFFAEHPDALAKIGTERVNQALAEHLALKLESLYWRRKLKDFRALLRFADEQDLDSPAIRNWRRKARWPGWVIGLKDRLTGSGRVDD
jgi:glycosyltransferase involved in cell wall biosynthesis